MRTRTSQVFREWGQHADINLLSLIPEDEDPKPDIRVLELDCYSSLDFGRGYLADSVDSSKLKISSTEVEGGLTIKFKYPIVRLGILVRASSSLWTEDSRFVSACWPLPCQGAHSNYPQHSGRNSDISSGSSLKRFPRNVPPIGVCES